MLDGGVHPAHKSLTHDRAHAATHELELKTSCHHANAQHGATHHHQRVGLAGVLQRFFKAVWVLAAVLELEGIHRQHLLPDLVPPFIVQKQVQPGPCPNAVVVAAGRADILVVLQVGLVQHGFATGTFDP